jgi:hypothetical protein
MCPGHLVEKWMREVRETLPQAKIVNLNNPGLKELFALKDGHTPMATSKSPTCGRVKIPQATVE